MDSNSTSLLPGQSAPIAVITATDQSGIVLIATTLALAVALVSLLMRVYMQLQIRHQFSNDDFITMGSMVSGKSTFDSAEWLTFSSCLLCFSPLQFICKSRKALEKQFLILIQPILYSCRRYVERTENGIMYRKLIITGCLLQ
jgi:hypothetical protein